MLTTIDTALSEVHAINPQTQKVMDYIQGKRSTEEKIREYFGLHIYFSYDEEGNIVRTHDEATNELMLRKYGVKYTERLKELGVSEEDFYLFFPTLKPYDPSQGDADSDTQQGVADSKAGTQTGTAKSTGSNTG